MNVGMDIGGTIIALPELMAILAQGLRAQGHKVYIPTTCVDLPGSGILRLGCNLDNERKSCKIIVDAIFGSHRFKNSHKREIIICWQNDYPTAEIRP